MPKINVAKVPSEWFNPLGTSFAIQRRGAAPELCSAHPAFADQVWHISFIDRYENQCSVLGSLSNERARLSNDGRGGAATEEARDLCKPYYYSSLQYCAPFCLTQEADIEDCKEFCKLFSSRISEVTKPEEIRRLDQSWWESNRSFFTSSRPIPPLLGFTLSILDSLRSDSRRWVRAPSFAMESALLQCWAESVKTPLWQLLKTFG